MGLCLSKIEKEDIVVSKKIDKELIDDFKLKSTDVKMLLLGNPIQHIRKII